MQRAMLRAAAGTSRRREWANSSVRPRREHEPGNESCSADQHRKAIVIEVAGLQPHHVAGDVKDPRGNAIRAEAVDQPAITALPQQAAQSDRGPHKNEVIKLVEVPLVEQESVQIIM